MMRWVAVAVVLAGAACSGAARPRAEPPADLLVVNARVYTGDPAAPWAESLAVRGDRIVVASAATRVIDAGGRVVIPGINDAHVHAPDLGDEDWVEAPIAGDEASADEILRAIAATVAKTVPGTLIHGNLGVVAVDDPALDLAGLDRVAPEHPVWLDNLAGHLLVLNSAALRAFGVGDVPPPGGFRDGGRLYEYARWRVIRDKMMAVDDASLQARIVALSAEAAAHGITTIQVMSNLIDHRRLIALLERVPPAIRWHVIRFPIGELSRIDDARSLDASARVSLAGIKYILDGSPIERGAALEADYSDRPGWRGRLNVDRAQLEAILREGLRSGERLHLHVSGDRILHVVLDAMAATADAAIWRAHRLVIEHGDALAGPDVARAHELGIVVVQNPSHFTLPALMRRRYDDRLDDFFRIRELVDAGIPFAIGSDGPLNPFLNVMFATTRPDAPEQALTREQTISAYTAGSAFGEGLEADKGRLVPGMLADFAILSADPFTVPADQLPGIHSVLTVVGGAVAHDSGELTATSEGPGRSADRSHRAGSR